MFRFSNNFKIVFKRDLTYYDAYRLDNAITKFPSRTVRCMILHGLPVRDSWALPRSRLAPFQTLFDPRASPPPGKAWSMRRAQTNGLPWERGLLRPNRAQVFCDLNKTARVFETDEWSRNREAYLNCLPNFEGLTNHRCLEVHRLLALNNWP